MGRMVNKDRRDQAFEKAVEMARQMASEVASVTPANMRSDGDEIGVAMIKGGGMPFAEVDLGDHGCAVIVYGIDREEAEARAARLAKGWNSLNKRGE